MCLTVGFDLDMTLIDARPGMRLAMDELAVETGLALDGGYFVDNLGPPLATVFGWFGVADELIPDLVVRYRASYPRLVIPSTVAMRGAVDAIAAVRALGGRVVVVTGKHAGNARLHIEALGWEVDHLAGELWAADKGIVLREQGATVYVGDHVGDVTGALAAGAAAVAVATGPCGAEELACAGAEAVLSDLTEFPDWLANNSARFAGPGQSRS
ncbi:MAG: HAD family hydrolase [Kutzneria sp.]|nr:HAD family hydrolase [Kutzneria sp.]MBV9843809.1 HAD family hydrolase [Kutzneria sp.]